MPARALPVSVKRRASARRMTLRVSQATGEITLTLPERADFARRPALRRKAWRLDRGAHGETAAERARSSPAPGVPLRGVPHRIVHWSRVRGVTHATTDEDGAPIIAVSGDAAHVPRRVQDFLRKRGAGRSRDGRGDAIPARSASPPARSPSATPPAAGAPARRKGHLNFSWRLILAPPLVLDYLAAHEVAHLKEMNHSHRFWALTHRLCPRTEEAEAWLKRHGAGLHGYG